MSIYITFLYMFDLEKMKEEVRKPYSCHLCAYRCSDLGLLIYHHKEDHTHFNLFNKL